MFELFLSQFDWDLWVRGEEKDWDIKTVLTIFHVAGSEQVLIWNGKYRGTISDGVAHSLKELRPMVVLDMTVLVRVKSIVTTS